VDTKDTQVEKVYDMDGIVKLVDFSPDGSELSFIAHSNTGYSLYVLNLNDKVVTMVTDELWFERWQSNSESGFWIDK